MVALAISLSLFANDEKRIETALKNAFPLFKRDEIHLKPLTDGYSYAKNFLIDVQGKFYVLRMQKESESVFKLHKELYMMAKASNLGIAPKLHYVSDDGKCTIMEFIEGGTLTLTKAKNQEFADNFGKTILKLHQIPKDEKFCEMTFIKAMQNFYLEFELARKKYEKLELNIPDLALKALYEHNADLEFLNHAKVNIHGDLNPRNILSSNGNILLIDWTENLFEEPFHDLAYYSILLDYDEKLEETLLKSYLNSSLTIDNLNRFHLCKKMQFARLALGASYVVLQRMDLHGETIDQTAVLKNWFEYMDLFAEGRDDLPAQFFYEVARLASLQMQ